MRCTVLVPSLFWSQASGLQLPALETLLTKAERRSAPAHSAQAWLCEQFGVATDQELPIAAFTLLADGGEPGARYWLRADPVHLAFENNQLVLIDSAAFALDPAEAEQLIAALNAHFQAGGMHFVAQQSTRWYLSLDDAPRIETTPVHDAGGKLVDPRLPRGRDALLWHRLQNEAQMMLHDHSVNAKREGRGEPVVNSVWFWGLGRLPARVSSPFTHVYANDPLARGLAIAAKLRPEQLPANANALPSDTGANALVVLCELNGPARYGDEQTWQRTLQQFEERWFAPLLGMLRKGAVQQVTLHSIDGATLLRSFTVRGADLWKFWRSRKPIAELAGAGR